MMTSKERAAAVCKNKPYDRLPMWYGGAEETTRNLEKFLGAATEREAMDKLGIDYATVRPRYIGPPLRTHEDGSVDSVWGVRRHGFQYGQAANHPLAHAETIADIENYPWPRPEWWDARFTDEDQKLCKDYFVIGGAWSPYFHEVIELLGMEKCFMDMYDNPALVEALVEKVFAVYYDQTEKALALNPGCIDMIFFGNDFGSQRALLCSREMWRRFFMPPIKRLVELAHRHSLPCALHSCGDIHEIIPDLIDIGVDILNPIQVFAEHMDPVVLKKQFGKDIIFFGGIDENIILSTGTEQRVRDETRRIIDILGSDGKYIVAPSHDLLLPEIPTRNIWAMYDEARKYSAK